MNFKNVYSSLTLLIIFMLQSLHATEHLASDGNSCPTDLKKLDILPGQGWDSLRNIEMERVVALTYKECKTTLDGKYLLPDHVFAVPLRNNHLELYSEVIDSISYFQSTTAKSMGVSAGGTFIFDASAKFSDDYQNMKKHQIEDESVTTRVTARYTLYKVDLLRSIEQNLNPELKSSFYDAIDAFKANNTEKACLILEIIVRDYGTHFVTRTDAGAMIMKEDFVLRKFIQDDSISKQDITAAASMSFMNKFNFGAWYKSTVEQTIVDAYSKSTTSSTINSHGGTWFRPNSTVDEWISSINDNLASIDKSGDPLYFLITPETFPDVPSNILSLLRNSFIQAITEYYSYNTHEGCMIVDSPNFDYNANVAGKCEKSTNNFTLGGVFQTCTQRNPHGIPLGEDFCDSLKMNVKNPSIGKFECQPPYTAVLLKNGEIPHVICRQECTTTRVWIFWSRTECHDVCYTIYLDYSTYWCAAANVEVPNTGMMFGGLFTSKVANPVTSDHSCPPTFTAYKILQDLSLCLGDTYEVGIKFNVPFGGFFTCQNGNPLYDIKILKNNGKKSTLFSNSIKVCPNGFSQHQAVNDNDCLVHYCVLANSFRPYGEISIVLPPFRNFTELFDLPNVIDGGSQQTQLNGIGIFIGFVIAVILCGILALGFMYWSKHRRSYESQINSSEQETREGETDGICDNIVTEHMEDP